MPNLALSPGFYPEVSELDYHADNLCAEPTLSRSIACMLVDASPNHAHCAHPRLNPNYAREDDSNAAMAYGELAHKMLLGKGGEIVTIDVDDWKTKAAREFRDAAREAGQIPTLLRTYEKAKRMSVRFTNRMAEFGLLEQFTAAKPEVVMIWRDGRTLCRALVDKLFIDEERGKFRIFDLKVGSMANPTGLAKHVLNSDYHCQEQFYLRGVEILRPDLAGRGEFIFLNIEAEDPFDLVPSILNGEFKMLGTSKMMRAVMLWQRCLDEDRWPRFTDEILKLEPPAWALPKEFGAKAFA